MEERESITKQADFYRWLRERNAQPQIQKRLQLEIPEPPKYKVPAEETEERGIYIIEF